MGLCAEEDLDLSNNFPAR